MTPYLVLGITFAMLAGMMNGAFTLPMRYMARWSWENVWALFILVSCVMLPIVIACTTVPDFAEVLRQAPHRALCWHAFQGLLGDLAPSCLVRGSVPSEFHGQHVGARDQRILRIIYSYPAVGARTPASVTGESNPVGALVGIVGIACCGYAGFLKEKSQQGGIGITRGKWWVTRDHLRSDSLLCVGFGYVSAVFNIGYSSAQPLLTTAIRMGHSAFAGSNLIWLLMLVSGAVPNLIFCAYLLQKNKSWAKYRERDVVHLYLLSILMGLLWGGNTFVYGFASPALGAWASDRVAPYPDHRLDYGKHLRLFDGRMETHPHERATMDGFRADRLVIRHRHAGLVQHVAICVVDLWCTATLARWMRPI